MLAKNTGKPWAPEEDSLLTQAVAIHGENDNWKTIALSVPGRTNKACRKRWLHSLSPSVKKTAWTPEEDRLLLSLYAVHATKWAVIARHIPGRTDDACSKRYREALDPTLRRDDWTAAEDVLLAEAYGRLGGKWGQVGQELNRSGLGCRNRWRMLERRKAAVARGSATPSSAGPGNQNQGGQHTPQASWSAVPSDNADNMWDPSTAAQDPGCSAAFHELRSEDLLPGPSSSFYVPVASMYAGDDSHAYVPGGGAFQDIDLHYNPPSIRQPPIPIPECQSWQEQPNPAQQSRSRSEDDVSASMAPPTRVGAYSDDGTLERAPAAEHAAEGGHSPQSSSSGHGSRDGDSPLLHNEDGALDEAPGADTTAAILTVPGVVSVSAEPSCSSPFADRAAGGECHGSTRGESSAKYYRTPAQKAQASAIPHRKTRDGPPPRLSSNLPVATDLHVLAYACGHPDCWPDDAACGTSCFETSKELSDHNRLKHPEDMGGPTPFRCGLSGCKKSWKSINGLQYHLQISKAHFQQALSTAISTHAEESSGGPELGVSPSEGSVVKQKKTYPCPHPQCRSRYKQLSGLRYHLAHGHPDKLPTQLGVIPPMLARKMAEKAQAKVATDMGAAG